MQKDYAAFTGRRGNGEVKAEGIMGKTGRGTLIAEEELIFKFSRGGGPGGQNVNKVNTRVTVLFDAANSGSFSDEQKERMLRRLASRADKDGVSQQYRTQKANRDAAVERLEELLRGALKKKKMRKKTRVPASARRERLEKKKRRGFLKKQRAERNFEQ